MYKNLEHEIAASGMSYRSVAAAIGMPESTFRGKMNRGSFTVEEAFKIKQLLFPKYEYEYLFAEAVEEAYGENK